MSASGHGHRGVDGFLSSATFSVLHTPVSQGSALGWGVAESGDQAGAVELLHAGSNLRWYAVVRLVPDLGAGAIYVVNAGGNRADAAIDTLDELLTERFGNSR